MQKTDRFRDREAQLEQALHPQKMVSLWKHHIRSVLRNQPIRDLHDYYDFHINLDNRIKAIRTAIFQGIYQPARPIRFRSEKKLGVSRHLVLLDPSDALVFETIGDYLSPIVAKAQPSDRAYFSRNRAQPKSPVDVDESFGYPWWKLWPQFQARILEFSERHNYTVVTDVANYYDGIDFQQLRNYFSGLGHLSEILLDFFFFLLERFTWRPDYLPFSGKGLPQIELDAPRLVAHAFLFEIDRLLQKRTQNDFVRWLDDIDFGCDTRREAKDILGKIDELLLSRGLHLNIGKTQILTSQEAYQHFQLRENRYLTIYQKTLKKRVNKYALCHPKITDLRKRLRRRFWQFIKQAQVGQWVKVIKRYFNIASLSKDAFLEGVAQEYIDSYPVLRETIFRYFIAIGWSRSREKIIKTYLYQALDDAGFFYAINVLLHWYSAPTVPYILRMRELAKEIAQRKTLSHFLGSLWLVGKFGNGRDIHDVILQYIDFWKSNDWMARQVVSLWPRMDTDTRETVKNVLHSFGLTNAKLVLDNYLVIQHAGVLLQQKVKPYILATIKDGYYPLPKLLIALSVLQGGFHQSVKDDLRKQLLEVVHDPVSRYLIVSTG